jgi:hypothetical protein
MLAVVLSVALSLAACATNKEPFEYQSDNEARQGRGVFTGEDGAWTIYRRPMPPESQAAPAEEKDQGQPGTDAVEDDQTAPATSSPDG